MESKEQLEQELELLKNKKRLVELKLLCYEKGTTFCDLCTDIKVRSERLIKELMTKKVRLKTIIKIQKKLKLDKPTMFKLFFGD